MESRTRRRRAKPQEALWRIWYPKRWIPLSSRYAPWKLPPPRCPHFFFLFFLYPHSRCVSAPNMLLFQGLFCTILPDLRKVCQNKSHLPKRGRGHISWLLNGVRSELLLLLQRSPSAEMCVCRRSGGPALLSEGATGSVFSLADLLTPTVCVFSSISRQSAGLLTCDRASPRQTDTTPERTKVSFSS